MTRSSRLTQLLLLGLAAASLLWTGFNFGRDDRAATAAARLDPNARLISDALDRVRRDYFRPLAPAILTAAALTAALIALHDPYSHYYDRAGWRRFTKTFLGSGRFVGVGVALAPDRRGLRVVRVLPHSPASAARVSAGEVIIAVNGHALAGVPSDSAIAQITGPAGTHVSLSLATGPAIRTIALVRARVQDPSVTTTTLTDHRQRILDIRVDRFATGTSTHILRALDHATKTGFRGAILDLRGNQGGLVTEAVKTASALLPRGATIVSLRTRAGAAPTYTATGGNTTFPLVELTDHNTISAGEIFTAALKDNHRALIIGQHTYGKGVFQELIPLSQGGIELTIGEYFTPSGHNLGGGGTSEGAGIAPDINTTTNALPIALQTLARQPPTTPPTQRTQPPKR